MRRALRAGVVAGLLTTALALTPSRAHAQDAADPVEQAWRRGNEAYLRGEYDKARAAYEQLRQFGVTSADLEYNLGVTQFRRGALGPAVWAFERALLLSPEDEDARFNLAHVRRTLATRFEDKLPGADREPLWARVATWVSPGLLSGTFLVLYTGAFALLWFRRRAAPENRPVVTAGAAVTAGGALLLGLLLLGRVTLDRTPFAIVLPDVVAVKEAADRNYRTSFQVHAGLRVRVVDGISEPGWVRVRLANGLEGWVRTDEVGLL